ncbi:hypothetical protein IC006_0465 [Sulfuracidifex tepidarius]|uniref:Polysaccharide biosynthesis protein C-terminal domain-containing protein n=1 Tax=Sulfuracidifex tepidarius TaxID=1294262 RepID=A0A510DSM0_9CREN|nr:lipopolysaccharide biosynthesis protein [Sulfuracidifex tepidarius]BBG23181.1 hypothetical protein IC006_0465 [Sulfuracidifex tepidarius]
MNPIRNWLKSLSVATVNVLVALVFFVVSAKISNPAFFGKIAILQLLEVIVYAFFFLIPSQIISRETAYLYAKQEVDKKLVGKFFSIPFLVFPFLLVLLVFPTYVMLSIPYLFLYVMVGLLNSILNGMNMYSESSATSIVFLIIRWGISIVAVILHNIYLFIGIWTLGGVIAFSLNYFWLSRKIGLVYPVFDIPFVFKSMREGAPLYLSNVANFFSSQGDRVTTSYLLGSYYLGIYQFAALVGGVPSMVLDSLSNVLLPTASFYKALGKDEKRMSSLSFRFFSLLNFLTLIISIPVGEMVIDRFFPEYRLGLDVFILLLISTTLPFSVTSLTNFIVAFKKDLRPFLILSALNGGLVLLTSFLLIPRMGIIGGAISQVIVATISSSFTIFYAIRTSVFLPGKKEIGILSMFPLIGIYEVTIDPPFLDFILILVVLLAFKAFKIISKEEVQIVEGFLPKRLSFISSILRILT